MAHSLSAKKRIRQIEKLNARNRWRLRAMRGAIKEFLGKLAHGSAQETAEAYKKAAQVIDKTAAKGVIHKNQAARRKSRLTKRMTAKATAKA
jgi:small subunit ribosomal protein S20